MTIFNKTCTFNVGNDALLMTKVTSLRLCLCQLRRYHTAMLYFCRSLKHVNTLLGPDCLKQFDRGQPVVYPCIRLPVFI